MLPPQLIDSHAHLTSPPLLPRVDEVIQDSIAAGVSGVVTIGTSLDDARAALALAQRYPANVFVGAGWHPHEAGQVGVEGVDAIAELWDEDKVVAIGEMGLDYHYDLADRDVQQDVFGRQLIRAADFDRPIIIHCREAFEDTIALLEKFGFVGRRVVFHCFTGTQEEADRLAKHGWRISFTGVVTFKKSEWLQEIARSYPADQIMIETDSPYLAPVPVRGRVNEPTHLPHIATCLASLRGVDVEEFAEQTVRNTTEFFGLPTPPAA